MQNYLLEESDPIERHFSILNQWGISNDPLIKAAFQLGGLYANTVYKVYNRIGSDESLEKISHLLEDKFLSKIVNNLRFD